MMTCPPCLFQGPQYLPTNGQRPSLKPEFTKGSFVKRFHTTWPRFASVPAPSATLQLEEQVKPLHDELNRKMDVILQKLFKQTTRMEWKRKVIDYILQSKINRNRDVGAAPMEGIESRKENLLLGKRVLENGHLPASKKVKN